MTLDPGEAEQALRTRLAEPLGLGVTEAAESVIAVANANMADAIRLISVRRGYDPREFALVCFGGAGPLHGAALARELAIPTVLVPPNPGTTSALGCLLVDIRHDFFTLLLGTVDDIDAAQVEREFAQLEEQAMERMRVEGVAPDKVELQRTIDMRYAGQWRSIAVPVDGEVMSLEDLARTFENEHDREHSYRREGSPIEVYRLEPARGRGDAEGRAGPPRAAGLDAGPHRSPARCTSVAAMPVETSDLSSCRRARRRELRGPRRARAARLHGARAAGLSAWRWTSG